MAQQKKQAQSTVMRWKKKRWFHIKAPKLFNEQEVGETPGETAEELVGRRIKVNLMHLTRDIKKQNYRITFEITKGSGDSLFTNFYGFEIIPAAVRKLIRRSRTRIDDSVVVKTNDNVKVAVKPLLVTRQLVNNSLKSELIKSCRKLLSEYASQVSYHQFAHDVAFFKVQKTMRDSLSKLYPLRNAEIRLMHFYREKKQPETPEETEISKDLKIEVKVIEKPEEEPIEEETAEESESGPEDKEDGSGEEQESEDDIEDDSDADETESDESDEAETDEETEDDEEPKE
ncbi:hypothetical protein JW968_02480 [Candidatus Woesearchaeota archaeon]|nr:hypothetical protein [Candidatus Woesearchaeota archaeon]